MWYGLVAVLMIATAVLSACRGAATATQAPEQALAVGVVFTHPERAAVDPG
jgi:hypothetical protein